MGSASATYPTCAKDDYPDLGTDPLGKKLQTRWNFAAISAGKNLEDENTTLTYPYPGKLNKDGFYEFAIVGPGHFTKEGVGSLFDTGGQTMDNMVKVAEDELKKIKNDIKPTDKVLFVVRGHSRGAVAASLFVTHTLSKENYKILLNS